ncbi:hypothetical protein MTO96_044590 [Rhipicephalus appendiculatus]
MAVFRKDRSRWLGLTWQLETGGAQERAHSPKEDLELGNRGESRKPRLDRENRELREELSRARLQNEKSAKKIDELQQTWNKILKHIGGGAPRWSPRPARGRRADQCASGRGG